MRLQCGLTTMLISGIAKHIFPTRIYTTSVRIFSNRVTMHARSDLDMGREGPATVDERLQAGSGSSLVAQPRQRRSILDPMPNRAISLLFDTLIVHYFPALDKGLVSCLHKAVRIMPRASLLLRLPRSVSFMLSSVPPRDPDGTHVCLGHNHRKRFSRDYSTNAPLISSLASIRAYTCAANQRWNASSF